MSNEKDQLFNTDFSNVIQIEFDDEEDVEEKKEVTATTENDDDKEIEESSDDDNTEEKEDTDLIEKVISFGGEGEEEEDTSKDTDEKISKDLELADDDFDYKMYAQGLIESGEWKEVEGFEDMEVDKDTFEEIRKIQLKAQKSKLKEEVLNELDDSEKEYLDFKKNGGSIDEWYASRKRMEQITDFDISTDENKAKAVVMYYRNLGEDDEDIRDILENAIENNKLDKLAEKAKEKLEHAFKSQHEAMLERQAKADEQRQERLREYKKDIAEVYKKANLSDSVRKTAVKRLTDINPKTNLTAVDQDYIAFRNDPEKAMLLERFLADPDKFMDKVTEKEVTTNKTETMLRLKTNKKQENEKGQINTQQKKKSGRIKTTKNPFLD